MGEDDANDACMKAAWEGTVSWLQNYQRCQRIEAEQKRREALRMASQKLVLAKIQQCGITKSDACVAIVRTACWLTPVYAHLFMRVGPQGTGAQSS